MSKQKQNRIKTLIVSFIFLLSWPTFSLASENSTSGLITAISSSAVTVDAVLYTINASTSFEDANGNAILLSAFAVGDFVEAEGSFSGSSLIASKLQFEDGDNDGGNDIDVEGDVSAISASSITVQGHILTIDSGTSVLDSGDNAINISTITVGTRVKIKSLDSNQSVAKTIKLAESDSSEGEDENDDENGNNDPSDNESHTDVLGSIDSVTSDNITISGVDYQITNDTRIENEQNRPDFDSSLTAGMFVKVEFYVNNSQNIARRIEVKESSNESDKAELRGTISALSATLITVRGVDAVLNAQTLYEGAHDASASFSDLHVGQVVKVKVKEDPGHTSIAIKVEIREHFVSGDMDDDGKPEKLVYRSNSGTWYVNYGSDSNGDGITDTEPKQWGLPSDKPFRTDVDGDGRTDLTVFRPSSGTWYILLSDGGYQSVRIVQWGLSGDDAFVGDFDGDHITDLGIWRPASGKWYILLSHNGNQDRLQAANSNPKYVLIRQWGLSNHKPKVGDRDGDGRDDLIVQDPNTLLWFTLYSSSGYNREAALAGDLSAGDAVQFGLPDDDTLLGDLDGDGKEDITVYRNGTWYIKFSNGTATFPVQWGLPDDQPGLIEPSQNSTDLRDAITVWRPSDGTHYDQHPDGSTDATQWGLPGDDPVDD